MTPGAGLHIRRLVFPVYLPMVLLSIGIAAPAAAFPLYLSSLGASLAIVGFIVSLTSIGNLVIDLPSGVILARNPLGRVMFISFIVAGVSSAGVALTKSLVLIGLFTFLGGAARSVVVTAMMTYVRLTVPPGVRGRALSSAGGALRIGMLIGPLAGAFVAERLGVPFAFAVQAVCQFLAAALFVVFPHKDLGPVESRGRVSLANQARDLANGVRGRLIGIGTIGFAVLVLQLLRAARSVILPLWGDTIGLPVTAIGAVMSAGAVMDLVLFLPAGQIMDRAGRKVAGSLCIGLFAAGVALLPLTSGLLGFVLASMLIGLGNGFGAGINMTLGTDLAPESAVSAFLGAWRFVGDVGGSAGPAIVGAIAAAAGLPVSLLITGAIGGIGLLVMAIFAPETLRIARSS